MPPRFVHITDPDAQDVYFDPFDNDFPDYILDVQTAIEYAKQNAEGFPRAGIPLIHNGVLSNNEWWTYSALTPNRKILFPVKTKLNEITWDADGLGTSASFDLVFYKNGTDPGDIFYTHEVRDNTNFYEVLSGLTFSFNAGDWIRIKYIDQGRNITDGVMVLWISRIT